MTKRNAESGLAASLNRLRRRVERPWVESDFRRDWLRHLRDELTAAGYAVPDTEKDYEVSFLYFNALRRRIDPTPRVIREAPELACPPEHVGGYAAIKRKIEAGEQLEPHLSRNLKKLEFDDDMLNDWGIHHLHLGVQVEADGYVERDNYVLYAMFGLGVAYLIGIHSHGKWANQELVEIVHRNWPELLAPLRLDCVVPAIEPISESERKRMRRAGMTLPFEVGGAAHVALGGGVVMSGLSLRVVREAADSLYRVHDAEERLRTMRAQARSIARQHGVALPRPLKARLRVGANWAMYAEFSGMPFRLGLGNIF